MRTPAEVAKQIKKALRAAGFAATAKSRNYQVYITTDFGEEARRIAQDIYHMEQHGYLVVWVNYRTLPMPTLNKEEGK